ncbi:hypothetical protein C8R47DRAFT_250053 [Mycena vitilis]|nr:hypothetical protein C8R47DRAFT_250053 [Mycena vitilis]
MSDARDVALSTPELLEQILARLPMQDLIVTATLVSKTWHATTLTPHLQRILFFQPDPTSEPVQNPLLVAKFPPFFVPEMWVSSRSSWPDANSIKQLPWAAAPAAFRRREASWRRMLVRQPPVQTMRISETCDGQLSDYGRCAQLCDLDLRMGTLYDLVLPFIDRAASSFLLCWRVTVRADDLTLHAIFTSRHYSDELAPVIDEQFYTAGSFDAKSDEVTIDFGEWEEWGR